MDPDSSLAPLCVRMFQARTRLGKLVDWDHGHDFSLDSIFLNTKCCVAQVLSGPITTLGTCRL